jgi:hypothetical protein
MFNFDQHKTELAAWYAKLRLTPGWEQYAQAKVREIATLEFYKDFATLASLEVERLRNEARKAG